MNTMHSDPNRPCAPSCECSPKRAAWARRDFLKTIGFGAGALAISPLRAMAGPFTRSDFDRLVPADKKLSPEWLRSLTARGSRTTYRGAELEKIGMPVGGLCAGQVYLGGDGKLWHWDIFNQRMSTGADHYAHPMPARSPVAQGFALRIQNGAKSEDRPLDAGHWPETSFIGEYPIGYVEYRGSSPVHVSLEAFSPFIPLNTDDSSLPATVLEFTLKNAGETHLELELVGWLQNAVCLHSAQRRDGLRRNQLVRRANLLFLESTAEDPPASVAAFRPDIVFDDFEKGDYANWTATGTAFGDAPVEVSRVPDYQGDLGAQGKRLVNTHASAPGNDVGARDSATGTLTSHPFTVERQFITFLVGGGAHETKTCVNLLVNDQVVRSATGKNKNKMGPVSWDVRRWAGQTARLQIVDAEQGPWGNIGVDNIVFTDSPQRSSGPLAAEADFGSLGLALLNPLPDDFGHTQVSLAELPGAAFTSGANSEPARVPFGQDLVGCLGRKLKLAPGASAKVAFLAVWHMPNLKINRLPPGRHYAARFHSALSVAQYVATEFSRLSSQTRLWHDTWYDSTLPYWFLDRTFLNTSILATSTCYRFGDGRFYAWEGVGCCEGTCGHVWQYAHAAARLFPDLERTTRERIDFGLALQSDGAIHFRGEFNNIPAIDAQAGTLLRALREHQMSADNSFLRRNWPQIKKAAGWLLAKDGNGDGLIESNQHNTLDTDWFGPVAWLSGLYVAALLATETMARTVGDQEFADQCRALVEAGRKNIVGQLFDGEYFINKPDPKHLDAINSGTGCEIDQVFGQSWAFQVGLPRVLPERQTRSALRSLWKYNFTPDVGPYREAYKAGRWYAMPGEAGLLMCTFPRSDWDYAQAKGKGPDWAAGYFNECMNGFEYQVAGHMLWEGMLTEALAITRAVHDRYHPSRRNPWNEVECGDHYARSMASYGVFLAACGFGYDGPAGRLGFAPRLVSKETANAPLSFKAAFTTAEGWGTYSQSAADRVSVFEISIRYGKLRLKSVEVPVALGAKKTRLRTTLAGRNVSCTPTISGDRLTLTFKKDVVLFPGQPLQIRRTG